MSKVTITFDLDDDGDRYEYEIHKQARALYSYISDIHDGLRAIEKHDSFPVGVYPGMIEDNLTDGEKSIQEKVHQAKLIEAERDYKVDLEMAEKNGQDTTKVRQRVPQRRFELYDDEGHCTISGATMVGILRDYLFELARDNDVKLDI